MEGLVDKSLSNPERLMHELELLEAQRPVATAKLRTKLLHHAEDLLDEAVAQARSKDGRPGSPALLRLIARLAMRDVKLDRSAGKRAGK